MSFQSKLKSHVVNGHTFTVSSDKFNFDNSKILGRGAFGVVCTSLNLDSNKVIAIKRIRPFANDEWDAKHTLREIRLLRILGPHPNIISLYSLSLYEEKSELYMMMELMDCDLHRVIQSKQVLTIKHQKCFIKQILEGIRAMHSVGVFHRDLKPGNILVSKDCQVRITDFGLARFMDESTRQGNNNINPMTEYVVTRWYRAPELLLAPNTPYDEAIDLWAIGCIIAELMRRKPLFPGKSHGNQVQLIFEIMGYVSPKDIGFTLTSEASQFLEKRCMYKSVPLESVIPGIPSDGLELVYSLLSVNPTKRPSAEQAVNSTFLKDADVICDYSRKYLSRPYPSDFDFEQEKFSLDDLRRMIVNEVELYDEISTKVNTSRKEESQLKEKMDTTIPKQLSNHDRSSSIRGEAVGAILAQARTINKSSPTPRAPQTPTSRAMENIQSKENKNRSRFIDQSNESQVIQRSNPYGNTSNSSKQSIPPISRPSTVDSDTNQKYQAMSNIRDITSAPTVSRRSSFENSSGNLIKQEIYEKSLKEVNNMNQDNSQKKTYFGLFNKR